MRLYTKDGNGKVVLDLFDDWREGWRQGLTLVHFSAQPEPFRTTGTIQCVPREVLKLSRKADQCKPLGGSRD